MDLARELDSLPAVVRPSPLAGFEYVRGFGVFSLPFDSGHVLALRVFPENDFAPYRTVWHRAPDGGWVIHVDAPRLDVACPRYYGAAAREVAHARIELEWTGPTTLSVGMDAPRLEWTVTMAETPLVRAVNAVSAALPERLWRWPPTLRLFERLAGRLFDLGDVTLSGRAPNGQRGVLMPRRIFPVAASSARWEGRDLGSPARVPANPAIGELRLPAGPVFAVGGAYFEMADPEEYRRTREELRAATA